MNNQTLTQTPMIRSPGKFFWGAEEQKQNLIRKRGKAKIERSIIISAEVKIDENA